MKNSKRLLSLACSAVMLAAIAVPASAQTFTSGNNASALKTETTNATQLQARNYRNYGYNSLVKVNNNNKSKKLVQGDKKGPTSRLAESVVETLNGEDSLEFLITVAGTDKSEHEFSGEGEFDIYYSYDTKESYTGQTYLKAINDGQQTARIKGKIQFN